MSTHTNPMTNVTSKSRVSIRVRPIVIRPRKKLLEDSFSFMEMSMRKLKKYFKNESENNS